MGDVTMEHTVEVCVYGRMVPPSKVANIIRLDSLQSSTVKVKTITSGCHPDVYLTVETETENINHRNLKHSRDIPWQYKSFQRDDRPQHEKVATRKLRRKNDYSSKVSTYPATSSSGWKWCKEPPPLIEMCTIVDGFEYFTHSCSDPDQEQVIVCQTRISDNPEDAALPHSETKDTLKLSSNKKIGRYRDLTGKIESAHCNHCQTPDMSASFESSHATEQTESVNKYCTVSSAVPVPCGRQTNEEAFKSILCSKEMTNLPNNKKHDILLKNKSKDMQTELENPLLISGNLINIKGQILEKEIPTKSDSESCAGQTDSKKEVPDSKSNVSFNTLLEVAMKNLTELHYKDSKVPIPTYQMDISVHNCPSASLEESTLTKPCQFSTTVTDSQAIQSVLVPKRTDLTSHLTKRIKESSNCKTSMSLANVSKLNSDDYSRPPESTVGTQKDNEEATESFLSAVNSFVKDTCRPLTKDPVCVISKPMVNTDHEKLSNVFVKPVASNAISCQYQTAGITKLANRVSLGCVRSYGSSKTYNQCSSDNCNNWNNNLDFAGHATDNLLGENLVKGNLHSEDYSRTNSYQLEYFSQPPDRLNHFVGLKNDNVITTIDKDTSRSIVSCGVKDSSLQTITDLSINRSSITKSLVSNRCHQERILQKECVESLKSNRDDDQLVNSGVEFNHHLDKCSIWFDSDLDNRSKAATVVGGTAKDEIASNSDDILVTKHDRKQTANELGSQLRACRCKDDSPECKSRLPSSDEAFNVPPNGLSHKYKHGNGFTPLDLAVNISYLSEFNTRKNQDKSIFICNCVCNNKTDTLKDNCRPRLHDHTDGVSRDKDCFNNKSQLVNNEQSLHATKGFDLEDKNRLSSNQCICMLNGHELAKRNSQTNRSNKHCNKNNVKISSMLAYQENSVPSSADTSTLYIDSCLVRQVCSKQKPTSSIVRLHKTTAEVMENEMKYDKSLIVRTVYQEVKARSTKTSSNNDALKNDDILQIPCFSGGKMEYCHDREPCENIKFTNKREPADKSRWRIGQGSLDLVKTIYQQEEDIHVGCSVPKTSGRPVSPMTDSVILAVAKCSRKNPWPANSPANLPRFRRRERSQRYTSDPLFNTCRFVVDKNVNRSPVSTTGLNNKNLTMPKPLFADDSIIVEEKGHLSISGNSIHGKHVVSNKFVDLSVDKKSSSLPRSVLRTAVNKDSFLPQVFDLSKTDEKRSYVIAQKGKKMNYNGKDCVSSVCGASSRNTSDLANPQVNHTNDDPNDLHENKNETLLNRTQHGSPNQCNDTNSGISSTSGADRLSWHSDSVVIERTNAVRLSSASALMMKGSQSPESSRRARRLRAYKDRHANRLKRKSLPSSLDLISQTDDDILIRSESKDDTWGLPNQQAIIKDCERQDNEQCDIAENGHVELPNITRNLKDYERHGSHHERGAWAPEHMPCTVVHSCEDRDTVESVGGGSKFGSHFVLSDLSKRLVNTTRDQLQPNQNEDQVSMRSVQHQCEKHGDLDANVNSTVFNNTRADQSSYCNNGAVASKETQQKSQRDLTTGTGSVIMQTNQYLDSQIKDWFSANKLTQSTLEIDEDVSGSKPEVSDVGRIFKEIKQSREDVFGLNLSTCQSQASKREKLMSIDEFLDDDLSRLIIDIGGLNREDMLRLKCNSPEISDYFSGSAKEILERVRNLKLQFDSGDPNGHCEGDSGCGQDATACEKGKSGQLVERCELMRNNDLKGNAPYRRAADENDSFEGFSSSVDLKRDFEKVEKTILSSYEKDTRDVLAGTTVAIKENDEDNLNMAYLEKSKSVHTLRKQFESLQNNEQETENRRQQLEKNRKFVDINVLRVDSVTNDQNSVADLDDSPEEKSCSKTEHGQDGRKGKDGKMFKFSALKSIFETTGQDTGNTKMWNTLRSRVKKTNKVTMFLNHLEQKAQNELENGSNLADSCNVSPSANPTESITRKGSNQMEAKGTSSLPQENCMSSALKEDPNGESCGLDNDKETAAQLKDSSNCTDLLGHDYHNGGFSVEVLKEDSKPSNEERSLLSATGHSALIRRERTVPTRREHDSHSPHSTDSTTQFKYDVIKGQKNALTPIQGPVMAHTITRSSVLPSCTFQYPIEEEVQPCVVITSIETGCTLEKENDTSTGTLEESVNNLKCDKPSKPLKGLQAAETGFDMYDGAGNDQHEGKTTEIEGMTEMAVVAKCCAENVRNRPSDDQALPEGHLVNREVNNNDNKDKKTESSEKNNEKRPLYGLMDTFNVSSDEIYMGIHDKANINVQASVSHEPCSSGIAPTVPTDIEHDKAFFPDVSQVIEVDRPSAQIGQENVPATKSCLDQISELDDVIGALNRELNIRTVPTNDLSLAELFSLDACAMKEVGGKSSGDNVKLAPLSRPPLLASSSFDILCSNVAKVTPFVRECSDVPEKADNVLVVDREGSPPTMLKNENVGDHDFDLDEQKAKIVGVHPEIQDQEIPVTDQHEVHLTISLGAESEEEERIDLGTSTVALPKNWRHFESEICSSVMDNLKQIDENCLGLEKEDIKSIRVGRHEVAIGDTLDFDPNNHEWLSQSVRLKMHDVHTEKLSSLACETLIAKSLLEKYISLIQRHHFVIFYGPSGTGKSFLLRKLSNFMLKRMRLSLTDTQHEHGEEHKPLILSNITMEKWKELQSLLQSRDRNRPLVLVLDGFSTAFMQAGDNLNLVLDLLNRDLTYIIAAFTQSTSVEIPSLWQQNFRWVWLPNHEEPVEGLLKRYLRRKFLSAADRTSKHDLFRVADWLSSIWQHCNSIIERFHSTEQTIGPTMLFSCPAHFNDAEEWFVDVWNYSVAPYFAQTVKKGLRAFGQRCAWENPLDWMISTYPWGSDRKGMVSKLRKIRVEDIGFVMHREPTPTGATPSEQERLMDFLKKLEALVSESGNEDNGRRVYLESAL